MRVTWEEDVGAERMGMKCGGRELLVGALGLVHFGERRWWRGRRCRTSGSAQTPHGSEPKGSAESRSGARGHCCQASHASPAAVAPGAAEDSGIRNKVYRVNHSTISRRR